MGAGNESPAQTVPLPLSGKDAVVPLPQEFSSDHTARAHRSRGFCGDHCGRRRQGQAGRERAGRKAHSQDSDSTPFDCLAPQLQDSVSSLFSSFLYLLWLDIFAPFFLFNTFL